MACATLKRSLDWEPVLGGRPAKRRRCLPFCESPRERASPPLCLNSPTTTTSSKTTLAALLSTPTTLSSLSSSLTSSQSSSSSSSSTKTTTPPSSSSSSSTSTVPPNKPTSIFPDVVSKKLTPEYMAENIRAELRKLHRRKQLQYNNENNTENNNGNGESSSRLERPLFTFKQVGLICERMVRELESEIREEYDNVLAGKLAEQYDAFVKFTYDQIHKNYNEATPSYLS